MAAILSQSQCVKYFQYKAKPKYGTLFHTMGQWKHSWAVVTEVWKSIKKYIIYSYTIMYPYGIVDDYINIK